MRPSVYLTLGALAGCAVAIPTPNADTLVAMPLDTRSFWKRVVQDGALSVFERQNTCQVTGNGFASASSSSGSGCQQGNMPAGGTIPAGSSPPGWPSWFPAWGSTAATTTNTLPGNTNTLPGNTVTTGNTTTVGNQGANGQPGTIDTSTLGTPAEIANLKTADDATKFVNNSGGKYIMSACSASSNNGGSVTVYNINGVCFKPA